MISNRYAFLDGIRGMAAIFVLMRHASDFWNFFPFRSHLAVDLFFILSGFVIAHAYDEKLHTQILSARKFVLIRLIRLYPVFLLSLAVCTLFLLIKIFTAESLDVAKLYDSIQLIGFTALFLPSHAAGSPRLFPINGPYWSLFFELIVNGIYALFRPWLNDTVLFIIILIFGGMVIRVALQHGNLDSGFEWDYFSLWAGFSRAMFGIFLGLLLYRHQNFLIQQLGKTYSPWLTFPIIAAILASPSLGSWDAWIDLLAVLVIFPLSVLIASQAVPTRLETGLLILGSASYPIYVLHQPMSDWFRDQLPHLPLAPLNGIFFTLLLILLSLGIEKFYDLPVRRWLTQRFLK